MPLLCHEDGCEKVRVKHLYCNDIHARCLMVLSSREHPKATRTREVGLFVIQPS